MPVPRNHASRNLVRAACQTEWQIQEEKLEAVCELLLLRSQGLEFTSDEVRVRIAAYRQASQDDEDEGGPQMRDGVAVLPLHGVLAPRMNLMSSISGGTSTQQFAQWFSQAMANPEVLSIVLDVDSPGGTAQGNEEVANLIRANRGKGKPIVAVATGLMASAAYYIGSAADQIVASPSAQLGSIGTFLIHRESSRADQNAGHTYSIIKAGANKAAGNSTEPLNSSSRAVLQEAIDDLNQMFVSAVAANRKVSAETVEQNFGQGKSMLAPRAVAAGLADRIATLDQVVGEQAQAARGRKKLGAFDPAIIGADTSPPASQLTTPQSKKSPVQSENSMNPRIKQALIARGLISADASDADATLALNVFFATGGQTVPAAEDAIVAALAPAKVPAPAPTEDQSAARAAIVRQAQATERARIQDLEARAQLLQIDRADVQTAIDGGLSVQQALDDWTGKLAAAQKPVVRVDTGASADGKFAQAAVDALWHRSGSPVAAKAKPLPESADLRYKSLLQIAEMTLQRSGVRYAGRDPDDIAAAALFGDGSPIPIRAHSDGDGGFGRPGDFPNILSALVGKMLDLPLEYFPSTYRNWAYELPAVPDFKPKTILAAGEFGELPRVPDGDDFKSSTIGEEASWIAVDSYGDEFPLTPRMIVDDNLGAFEEAVRDKNVAHDMTLNRLCVELLTGNAVAGDGVTLYSSGSHGNDIAGGSGGPPSQTQLSSMRLLLRGQTGVSKKRKLNLNLKGLLIPSELETTTQQLLSTNVRVIPVTTATGEIFRGELDYWVEPMLSDVSATQWYGFANKAVIRPIVYCHQVGFEAMKSRLYFNPKNNSRVFQCEGRMAAAVRNWRGTIRNAGS
jgi:signal peptide peptidase SppA